MPRRHGVCVECQRTRVRFTVRYVLHFTAYISQRRSIDIVCQRHSTLVIISAYGESLFRHAYCPFFSVYMLIAQPAPSFEQRYLFIDCCLREERAAPCFA